MKRFSTVLSLVVLLACLGGFAPPVWSQWGETGGQPWEGGYWCLDSSGNVAPADPTRSVAMSTPVVAGTSTYVCGATATSVTVDLSKAATHLVTLSNISGVSLIFTGLPTLTNQRVVYQLDLIQPATGATVDPVWVGATAHKSATSPVTTAPNGGRDSFGVVYGTMGTTLVIYPAGPDMR